MASKLPEGVQGLREGIQPEGSQEHREAVQPEGDPTAILPEGSPTPRAPRKRVRVLDEKEQVLVVKAARFVPKVEPFPKNAHSIERTTFPFERKHGTRDGVRDNLKRIALYKSDLIGDKRREILRILPLTDQNKEHILKLRDELSALNYKLGYRLQKLKEVDPAEGEPPKHFQKFPELKKKR